MNIVNMWIVCSFGMRTVFLLQLSHFDYPEANKEGLHTVYGIGHYLSSLNEDFIV